MIRPPDAAALADAAATLQAGGLVGLPTETVYGLAADANNARAVARIFAAKGRPIDHPLIVHLASAAAVPQFAASVPDFAQRLMLAFWPGPLTLILPRRADVAAAAAGGQNSVGLRCPAHPVAQALLRACAERGVTGLAAPSANLFGRVSPTTATHVQQEFGDDLLVLDGGACQVGIESTIVDCTRGMPVLLRPGVLTVAELEAACGQALGLDGEPGAAPRAGLELGAAPRVRQELGAAPRASGTLEAHYAPRAKLRLMDGAALQAALDVLGPLRPSGPCGPSGPVSGQIAVWSRCALRAKSPAVRLHRMPNDAAAAAHSLFSTLREFDAQGAQLIWVETPPDTPVWAGVRDRLQRAAASG